MRTHTHAHSMALLCQNGIFYLDSILSLARPFAPIIVPGRSIECKWWTNELELVTLPHSHFITSKSMLFIPVCGIYSQKIGSLHTQCSVLFFKTNEHLWTWAYHNLHFSFVCGMSVKLPLSISRSFFLFVFAHWLMKICSHIFAFSHNLELSAQ